MKRAPHDQVVNASQPGRRIKLKQVWSPTGAGDICLQTAVRLLMEIGSPLAPILVPGGKPTPSAKSIAVFENDYHSAIWHEGERYLVISLGEPEFILRVCDLTENEREACGLMSRKLSAPNLHILACASGTIAAQPTSEADLYRTNRLDFSGFIILEQTI